MVCVVGTDGSEYILLPLSKSLVVEVCVCVGYNQPSAVNKGAEYLVRQVSDLLMKRCALWSLESSLFPILITSTHYENDIHLTTLTSPEEFFYLLLQNKSEPIVCGVLG